MNMKKENSSPHIINSISEQHYLMGLPKPQHPLIGVYRFEDIRYQNVVFAEPFVMNFYCIAIKKNFKGKLKYGQQYYDFDEGVMSFISPNQLLAIEGDESLAREGSCLVFHPDFIARHPLAKKIKSYGFFSYSLHEALHLSDKEVTMMEGIIKNIESEYHSAIDLFSQEIIIPQIELLLAYSNRFYQRQFITRSSANHDLLISLEDLLSDYFNSNKVKEFGLPTVQYIAGSLNVSPNYLSDMLRTLTGQNTQQHIHVKLIEKAKEILSTTSLSVSEIAYQLGFEYPQSFNKLFKNKTNVSPLSFRNSMN